MSEHPSLQPIFETFGAPKAAPEPGIKIETFLAPPMPRFWFEGGGDASDLIQIQQDRFIHNWRKRNSEYTRYEQIRDRYELEVAKFSSFVEKEELGTIRVNQCEVTYINTLETTGVQAPYAALDQFTPLWTGKGSDDFLPSSERGNIQASYVLRSGERPYGRVHVTFSPAINKTDDTPFIQLNITARGKPEDESVDAGFRLLDEHRKTIVRTFAAVTTPAMHEIWGRRSNDG